MSERVAPKQLVDLPAWARTFTSLQYRDYLLFWAGTFGCNTGYWMRLVAQGWLVLELTNSAFLLGLASFAMSIPVLFLGLIGGFAADTIDRRKLLLVALSLSGLLILLLAILTSTGLVNVWLILGIAMLSGVVQAFEMPTRHAIVPTLVPPQDLMNAISLNSAVWQVTRVIGPAIAGVLVGLVGVAGCLYLAAGTYLAIVFALLAMKSPAVNLLKPGSMLETIGEGLRYLRNNPTISTLIIMEAVPAIFAMPYQMLMPIFARDILDVGAMGLGVLTSANGLGALIGTLALASMGNFRRRGLLLLWGAIALGISLILFAGTTSFPLALAFMVAVGCSQMTYLATTNTLVQSTTKDEFRGRVMSVYTMAFMGLTPLGHLQGGAVAGLFGAPIAVVFGGAVVGLFAMGVMFRRRTIRDLP